MKKLLLLALLACNVSIGYSQLTSPTCITAAPICASTVNGYPSVTGGTTAQAGPAYGCLGTQPNASWFYFKIDSPGNINITITQSSGSSGMDVDYICWGPFTSAVAPCSGLLTAGTIKSCSYSTAAVETASVTGALNGEYYLLMITNFSNMPGTISFVVDSTSSGTLSCSETCNTRPDYNAPVCVNGTLQLLSTYHFGLGNYSWTGPAGFTSTLQNPSITTVTGAETGYYHLNYTRDSTCNLNDSIYVQIDTCGSLTGTVYADGNSNCTQDSGENTMANVQLKLTGSSYTTYAWTDPFGYYYFDVPPGAYTLQVVASVSHPITCAASLPHTVNVTPSAILSEDFAVDCGVIDLIASSMTAYGVPFFPGHLHAMNVYMNSVGPNCIGSLPGQVLLILDPLVHYSGPAGSTYTPVVSPAATGDTLRWSFSNIMSVDLYDYNNFHFAYTTDSTATIGDTIHMKLMVLPITGDVNPANNIYLRDFVVGNSYDPNNKLVTPAGMGTSGFIPSNTPRLEYLVNFQNTGTAPAHNIYILDTLDSDVDLSTLEIISSSHPQTTTLLPGNVLKFYFSNIMLPDSTNYEPQSHGFIRYSIAPNAGLNPGDEIRNTAYIYFDFNAPIITNTALNTIEFPTNVEEFNDYQLGVYPNPTGNTVNVVFTDKLNSQQLTVKIMNISGQVVYEESTPGFSGNYSKVIDLGNVAKGVYLLQISTDKQVIHKKVIKN